MKSIYYRDNLMPQNESTVFGEGLLCGSKRRRGFKEVPSSEILGEGLKVGDEVAGGGPVAAPLSNSGLFEASVNSTDDHIGSTVGILVGGGELCEEGEISGPARLSHGSISVIGRRRVMEDAVTIVPGIVGGEFSFFAVYDGHGGSRVANACRDRLHQLLVNELKDWKLGIDWEKVMMACFAKMDEEVSCSGGADVDVESTSLKMEGSTAVVVVVGKEELVVANCGDSRAVLGRGGVAVPLSRDHKPDRPDEKERVEAIGGRVINWNGSRVQGVLATSRSIGDHFLRPYVISEPEVTVNRRTELDSFLIIASDGLWDVVSNEIACDVVRRCLEGKIGKAFLEGSAAAGAAGLLAELAIAKGSKDNISVIVVELKPLH